MVCIRLLIGRVFIETRRDKQRMDYKEIELTIMAFLRT